MPSLEESIGYHFLDPAMLELAITHPSIAYEVKGEQVHNQRLEYLGDAVLQLIFTDLLYRQFPFDAEGLLTKLRTRLVQTGTLARVARLMDLGASLRLSRGEDASGGRLRDSILADALEALVGAIYLDGGYSPAQKFVLRFWKLEIEDVAREPVELNPKGQLQEILQDIGGQTPTYRIVSTAGPDHARHYQAVVVWRGEELAQGAGRSKKLAEIAAAEQALTSKTVLQLLSSAAASSPSTPPAE